MQNISVTGKLCYVKIRIREIIDFDFYDRNLEHDNSSATKQKY